jgi:hypothetical protein
MPHVTFIHGIGNKPERGPLHDLWLRSLASTGGLDLGAEGVTSSMVYWADVLYAAPDADVAAYEATAGDEELVDADAADVPLAHSAEEALFLASIAAKLGGTLAAAELTGESQARGAGEADFALERIPLPWPVKKLFLKNFLRDVHHYLFNVESRPRPGERYKVRDEIRSRFVEAIRAGPQDDVHIVVSHSMGTVIAYDCLKNVGECPRVDALITIGSPLGLDEVQDKLHPGYSRDHGYPDFRSSTPWVNVYDRLDPVCGFDPTLANDYRQAGRDVVDDVQVVNPGAWRHSIVKYMAQAELRTRLSTCLGL